MNQDDKLEAMCVAMDTLGWVNTRDNAERLLAALEKRGLTLYRARTNRNGMHAATATRMTPQLAERMREYAREHKHMTQAEIAAHFGVNPGRVSEALSGQR